MHEIIILYHSPYGHTEKVAQAIAQSSGGELLNIGTIDEAAWARLDAACCIVFGTPTYMGGVSAPMKAFMDASSKRWMAQTWKDKLAAGFVNAGTHGGDNLNALYQLMLFSLQHGMLWVGNPVMPSGAGDTRVNRLGAFAGLLTQSDNASPEVTPPVGDIETARLFGQRLRDITERWKP